MRKTNILLFLLSFTLILTACNGGSARDDERSTVALPATAEHRGGDVRAEHRVEISDFPLVVYQGHELLGGSDTTFAAVFAQGKPVVLNFWAGLCPPCRAEMPVFQAIADEYGDDVIFVGVDVGPYIGLGSQEDAMPLLQELGIRYPTAAATDITPLRLYTVQNMPTTIFFAPNGEIVAKHGGLLLEKQLRELVDQLVTMS